MVSISVVLGSHVQFSLTDMNCFEMQMQTFSNEATGTIYTSRMELHKLKILQSIKISLVSVKGNKKLKSQQLNNVKENFKQPGTNLET